MGFTCGKKVVAAYKLHQIDTEDKMCGICGFTGYRQDQKTDVYKRQGTAYAAPQTVDKLGAGYNTQHQVCLQSGEYCLNTIFLFL